MYNSPFFNPLISDGINRNIGFKYYPRFSRAVNFIPKRSSTISLGKIINTTQRSINTINQIIPMYKQIKPIYGQVKSFTKTFASIISPYSRNKKNNTQTNQTYTKTDYSKQNNGPSSPFFK